MYDNLVFVDVEAPLGVGAPSVGDMTEFGAVHYASRKTFHGHDCSHDTLFKFATWLRESVKTRPIFVSDNPAFDFQWINFYFWKHLGYNPFGHSGRRISDFYAGLVGDFHQTQAWKKLRITAHDHNPVHDAMGNCEAFERLLKGER
jgi:hypothetical protein